MCVCVRCVCVCVRCVCVSAVCVCVRVSGVFPIPLIIFAYATLTLVESGGITSTMTVISLTTNIGFTSLFDDNLSACTSEQTAAKTLGYTRSSWNNFSGKAKPPASKSKDWSELTDAERAAAIILGYSQITWSPPQEFNHLIRFVVLMNFLPPSGLIDETHQLKGCTVGRRARG